MTDAIKAELRRLGVLSGLLHGLIPGDFWVEEAAESYAGDPTELVPNQVVVADDQVRVYGDADAILTALTAIRTVPTPPEDDDDAYEAVWGALRSFPESVLLDEEAVERRQKDLLWWHFNYRRSPLEPIPNVKVTLDSRANCVTVTQHGSDGWSWKCYTAKAAEEALEELTEPVES